MGAKGIFCRLFMTFGNGLNPGQDRQNVGPDLAGSNPLVFRRDFLKKVNWVNFNIVDQCESLPYKRMYNIKVVPVNFEKKNSRRQVTKSLSLFLDIKERKSACFQ